MKTINTIDELAAHMFEVQEAAAPLGNPEFCCSLISCAITIAARDGLSDEDVLKLVLDTATTSLAVVRAQAELRAKAPQHGRQH